MLTPSFIEEMKQSLIDSRKKLEEELLSFKHEELGSDEDSNAQEVENDEVAQDVTARIKADLEKIDLALAKIDDGTYGTDGDGKEISEKRLRALPWADKAI